jgi:hypothetical protein
MDTDVVWESTSDPPERVESELLELVVVRRAIGPGFAIITAWGTEVVEPTFCCGFGFGVPPVVDWRNAVPALPTPIDAVVVGIPKQQVLLGYYLLGFHSYILGHFCFYNALCRYE